MSLKVNLAFCLFFVLWTSAFSKLYKLVNPKEIVGISCRENKNFGNTEWIVLKSNPITDYPFANWNENTTIKVHGNFEHFYASGEASVTSVLFLNHYEDAKKMKTYSVVKHGNFEKQSAGEINEISVWIQVYDSANFQLHQDVAIYSSTKGTCSNVRSKVTYIEVDNSANEQHA